MLLGLQTLKLQNALAGAALDGRSMKGMGHRPNFFSFGSLFHSIRVETVQDLLILDEISGQAIIWIIIGLKLYGRFRGLLRKIEYLIHFYWY